MSMKPKAPIPAEAAVTNAAPETSDKTETTVLDYPRPAPPAIEDANQQNQQEVHRNEEETPPKKFKKKKCSGICSMEDRDNAAHERSEWRK